MGGDNELNVRESGLQLMQNFLLPGWMQVHVYFINQYDAFCLCSGFGPKVFVQLIAAVAKLSDFQRS